MGRSRSRSRSRDRDRGRDRSHSSSSSSSEDSAEREERMQRERDDREGGGAPRRSGGLGRYLALSGAIWRYLALSGYLILSHSISCRSDKRIGQTRAVSRSRERARAVEFGPCGEATARWRSLYFMCEYGRVRPDE